MKLHLLQAFHAFMEQGTTLGAARKIGVGQPTLSRRLIQLEQEVGFKLFVRTRNNLSPTPEAYQYHVSVARLIGQLHMLEQEQRVMALRQSASVVVAAQPIFCDTFLLDVIARCSRAEPSIKVTLFDVGQEQMLHMLATGACDFALGITLGSDRFSVAVEPVATCAAVCILPPGHPEAVAEVVPLPRLRRDRFVDLPVGSPLRLRMDAMMQMVGIERDTVAEARTMRGVAELVQRGVGVAVADGLVRLLDLPSLIVKPLLPLLTWEIATLLASDARRRPEVEFVLAETRRALIRLVDQGLLPGCRAGSGSA